MTRRPDDDLTIGATVAATQSPSETTAGPGGRSPESQRLAPGSIIAGRYRLVALLGRGGMGEVYRAEDLTLDHPVALKFLPSGIAADGDRLAQFHAELRIARQVSHKNVCRLYDLGDADGRRFLTMEYVDGEDLASLLRRIGRVPQDKAVEIARQLCAGLAAAHERHVLHRDLKPANIMIDGDGNARIHDFGLAVAAGDSTAGLAGTPQYMAPEQLSGSPASVKTDLYALGLVLFELFTGRRVHEAKTLNELIASHQSGTLVTPSSVVRDLDPAIERTILRCLERDPTRRPASALAVAAGLPGGDPLAMALAAGETPSPDMLVAAAESEAMPVGPALAALAFFVVALGVSAAFAPRWSITALVPLEKPPEVLADRAEQVLGSLGYTDASADQVYGFSVLGEYTAWIERTDRSPERWKVLGSGSPSAIRFWYRTSPRDLMPTRAAAIANRVDPPETESGMKSVVLDTRGRLVELNVVPPQNDPNPDAATPPAWSALFDAAGLDMSAFAPTSPQWAPKSFADTRAAWEGPLAERSDLRVRIEAAAYRGRPTSMYIVGPWTQSPSMQPAARTTRQSVLTAFNVLIQASVLFGAALLARHHLRANRADRRGAARLAIAVFVSLIASWFIDAHHVSTMSAEVAAFFLFLRNACYVSGALWVMYLALEPYARRLWPDGLLGWSRLLSGRIKDPRVGREVLLGMAAGCVMVALGVVITLIQGRLGYPPAAPRVGNLNMLLGAERVISRVATQGSGAFQTAMFIVLIFVGLRFLLRRNWLVVPALAALLVVVTDQGRAITNGISFDAVLIFSYAALLIVVLLRLGLLAMTAMLFIINGLAAPVPAAYSGWAAAPAVWSLVALVAIACFAFYAARAGQPLLGKTFEQAA